MKQTKAIIITTLMITLLLSSYVAFASEYGSKEDPLVSLSYIKEILLPQTLENVDVIIEERAENYIGDIDKKLAEFETHFNAVASNDEFVQKVAESVKDNQNSTTLVTLTAGQTLTFNAGTEFLLRTGGASLANASGFVNITTGTNEQTAININHMYMTVENAQKIISAGDSTIMVFGPYTLG